MTDKGLIFKTYKQLRQLNLKKKKTIKKWAKYLNTEDFSQEDMQMANMKRCPAH